MKFILTIILVLVIAFVTTAYFISKKIHSPCETLINISKDPATLSVLFDKLTFYFDEPDYLASYQVIKDYPVIQVWSFHEIDYAFDIPWESLDIDPKSTVFAFRGDSKILDYSNLEPEQVSEIMIGIGARASLVFEVIEGVANQDGRVDKSANYNVRVECGEEAQG